MKKRVRVGALAALLALGSSSLLAQGGFASIFTTGPERRSQADCPDPQGGAQVRTPDDAWGCWASIVDSNPFNGSWLDVRIKPVFALVYINDKYVGTAEQFTKPFRPLRVGVGPQKVEFRAPGYRAVTFWMNSDRGKVTTASGALIRNP
jgi:hypothetical protein